MAAIRWCPLAGALAALPLAESAFGSPFEVDSTSIASDIELKASFDYRDGAVSDSFTAPKLAMATPLAENLELEVAGARKKSAAEDGEGRILTRGQLELKWRFVSGDEHHTSWALIPEVTIPLHETSAGARRGPVEIVLPLVAQKTLGLITLDARVGYGRELEREGEAFVPIGILARFHARSTLELGAEIAGEAPIDRPRDCALSANAGFTWEVIKERLEIHGLLGWTIRSIARNEEVTRAKLVAELRL